MLNNLFYVPIEPLEERYTEQWYRKFQEAFKENYTVTVIDGVPLSSSVDVGTFLDINSTIAYKNSQMTKIATLFRKKEIPNNSIFFFGDTEFWGLESLRLMADMNQINIKIYSFLHAGSYTKEDAFEIAAPYQKYTELGWIASNDKVFVGTQYHKDAFVERRLKYASPEDKEALKNKIIVTGNPMFLDEYDVFEDVPKQKKIIISNRFDYEKRPNLSLDFAYILKRRHPDWEIVVSTSRKTFSSNNQWLLEKALNAEKDGIITIKSNLSKKEYHKELHESKIMLSNSIEENFGYCITEAINYNTYPLCSNNLSHTELLEKDSRHLFDSLDEVIPKAEFLMNSDHCIKSYNDKYNSTEVIKFMMKEML